MSRDVLFWRISRALQFQTRRPVGVRDALVGGVHRRADLGRDPVPVRLHGTKPRSTERARSSHSSPPPRRPRGSLAIAAAPDLGSDADRKAGPPSTRSPARSATAPARATGTRRSTLKPRPRNFTTGNSDRTTGSGALPTTDDLKHIIHAGMPYTRCPVAEVHGRRARIYLLQSRSPDFAKPDFNADPIKFPKAPSARRSAEAGRKVYEATGCIVPRRPRRRRPRRGRWSTTGYPTAGGFHQRWTFRAGRPARHLPHDDDGLNGTPMPAFGDALTGRSVGDHRHMYSLGSGDDPHYANIITASRTTRSIRPRAPRVREGPVARIPIVGQIMEPGRSSTARRLERRRDLRRQRHRVLRPLERHERRDEGSNSPALVVPSKKKNRGGRDHGGRCRGRVGRTGLRRSSGAVTGAAPAATFSARSSSPPARRVRASRTRSAMRRTASTSGSRTSAQRRRPVRREGKRGDLRPGRRRRHQRSALRPKPMVRRLKRSLTAASGVPFAPGGFVPIAFRSGTEAATSAATSGLSNGRASTSSPRSSSPRRARRSRRGCWSSVSNFL